MDGYVQGKFSTKIPEFTIQAVPFSIPELSTSTELNELVNKFVSESGDDWKPKSFDFLINGSVLRSSLKEFIQSFGLSTENVLDIECIFREAPQPRNELMHDDWVGAVRATSSWVITGCFDNTINIWTHAGERVQSTKAHVGPVKCLAILPREGESTKQTFVSGSQDQTIAIWQFDTTSNQIICQQIGKGHERSVECICANTDGRRIASGGFDGFLKIWNSDPTDDTDVSTARSAKKLKTETENQCTVKTPMVTLHGHREAVMGVSWLDVASVATASWDRSIIIWDLEMAGPKATMAGAKAFSSLAYSPINGNLITGSADRHIRLWDPRSKDGSMVKSVFTAHTGWVSAVDWSKQNEYNFISTSFDRIMKLWDTRSPKMPLYDLTGHEDRLLCCDWSTPRVLISGGADNSVKMFTIKA